MTQEDRQILLKDICARLPYGVYYKHLTWNDERGEECIAAQIYSINSDGYVKNCYDDETVYIDNVRPYLFPLSSMTEKQIKELEEIDPESHSLICENGDVCISMGLRGYDWLNKNHFDYRGLIEKGLAIDATGLNIY